MYIFPYGLFCFYFFIFNVQFCFLKIVIELCGRKMLFLYVSMINIVYHSMNFEWECFCLVRQLHVHPDNWYLARLPSKFLLGFDLALTPLSTYLKHFLEYFVKVKCL